MSWRASPLAREPSKALSIVATTVKNVNSAQTSQYRFWLIPSFSCILEMEKEDRVRKTKSRVEFTPAVVKFSTKVMEMNLLKRATNRSIRPVCLTTTPKLISRFSTIMYCVLVYLGSSEWNSHCEKMSYNRDYAQFILIP